jgi:sugar O-acyltransferase (sialic acid O-acetyltransferase NeuD family)
MKPKLLLVGGGGHCKACIDVIESAGEFEILGIIDTQQNVGEKVLGYEIIGTDEELEFLAFRVPNALIAVGQIGSGEKREEIAKKLLRAGFKLPAIISPFAYVSKHATIGAGSIIMHHAVVNAGVTVGGNCIVNTKALIEHDTVVGDFCHIATAAVLNGGCRVADGSFVGSNAVVKECSNLPRNTFVKAGSLYRL